MQQSVPRANCADVFPWPYRCPACAPGAVRAVRLSAVEVEKARVGREHVVSERLLTIPNVLSVLRLLGVPLFLWAILSERDGLALLVLALSGVTDYLDGKIARRFNMESRLGQFL